MKLSRMRKYTLEYGEPWKTIQGIRVFVDYRACQLHFEAMTSSQACKIAKAFLHEKKLEVNGALHSRAPYALYETLPVKEIPLSRYI